MTGRRRRRARIAKGSLVAYHSRGCEEPAAVIGAVHARCQQRSIDEVVAGRDAVYASIYHDVTGSVHAFRAGRAMAWTDTVLPLPAGGSTHIVSANAWGPQAYLRFESYTTPTTLYAVLRRRQPQAIKSLPARFDATDLATEQFFATSADGTRVPYFVTRAKDPHGPAPTVLYGYGGFEISDDAELFGQLRHALAQPRAASSWSPTSAAAVNTDPAWHQAALLDNRQKAYDDFQAVARDIVRRGITTPSSSASWAARMAGCS